jgi:RimJ/RimL family protein N-acetyltransferase
MTLDDAGQAGERPIVNFEGTLVALGPHRRDLIPTYQRWINDFAMLRTIGAVPPRPTTFEQEEAWYAGNTNPGEIRFTIYERAGLRPIGTTAFHGLDYRNRTAIFGIFIGEADARGKGLGTETTVLMLDYAFTVLGLHSVMLTVAEFNPAAVRAYQKAGFREFGRRRQCRWMGGRLWDDVYMDCLAPEFSRPTVFLEYRDPDAIPGGTGHAPSGGIGEGIRPGPI